MRYHDLKEKDAMTLYEDGVGTVVIFYLKWLWLCKLIVISLCIFLRRQSLVRFYTF